MMHSIDDGPTKPMVLITRNSKEISLLKQFRNHNTNTKSGLKRASCSFISLKVTRLRKNIDVYCGRPRWCLFPKPLSSNIATLVTAQNG